MTEKEKSRLEKLLVFKDKEGDEVSLISMSRDKNTLYIPRGVLLDKKLRRLANSSEDKTSTAPVDFPECKFEPRDYQSPAIDAMLKAGGGTLQSQTGSGKTVMMLMIAQALGQRTLVLVHTKDLLMQWIERVEEMFGIECGVIGGGQWDEGKQITIATVQTLTQWELPAEWLETWGTVILDEAHRCPARTFSELVGCMTARHVFGTTATPKRRDKMHHVLYAVIGPVMYHVDKKQLMESGKLVAPSIKVVRTKFKSSNGQKMQFAKNQFARNRLFQYLLNDLVTDDDRNTMIAQDIIEHKDRHVLVLSTRIEHLENIQQKVFEMEGANDAMVTSAVDKDVRNKIMDDVRSGAINVIYATQLADEGLDIPILDTLILAMPQRDQEKLQQRIGRIMRSHPDKRDALVIDYDDIGVSSFHNMYKKRRAYYNREKYKIN